MHAPRFLTYLFSLWPIVLVSACGQGQQPPSQVLGGVPAGAPLAMGAQTADLGILSDPAGYQPAQASAGGSRAGGPAGTSARVAGGDPAVAARALANEFVGALKDGYIDVVLRSFSKEQIAPLEEKQNAIAATFEKVELVQRLLRDKFDPTKAEQILRDARGDEAKMRIEVVGEGASVTPNFAALILGPVAKGQEAMRLGPAEGGEWKIMLDKPLQAADADAIVKFHEQVQDSLQKLADWLSATETVTEAQVTPLLRDALQGNPVDPAGAGAAPAESGDAAPKDANAPPAEGPGPPGRMTPRGRGSGPR
jgi:hypothetical protein